MASLLLLRQRVLLCRSAAPCYHGVKPALCPPVTSTHLGHQVRADIENTREWYSTLWHRLQNKVSSLFGNAICHLFGGKLGPSHYFHFLFWPGRECNNERSAAEGRRNNLRRLRLIVCPREKGEIYRVPRFHSWTLLLCILFCSSPDTNWISPLASSSSPLLFISVYRAREKYGGQSKWDPGENVLLRIIGVDWSHCFVRYVPRLCETKRKIDR